MGKKSLISIISLCVLMSLLTMVNINITHAEGGEENTYATDTLPDTAIFTKIDENGNIVEISEDELNKSGIIKEIPTRKTRSIVSNEDVLKTKGVVNFRTKSSSSNTSYTEADTGKSGYTNGTYAADGAYLGHNADRTKVKFMQAGVIGWVDADEVQVLDFSSNEVQTLSKYYVNNGRLYHGIVTNLKNSSYSSKLDCGPKPSYLKEGEEYYSYDGHYFYTYNNTNGYSTMLNDYRNDTRKNSVNANAPYYNYYQFLPQRSQSVYSATEINNYINSKTSSTSKMRNLGQSFIDNQNKYGVNAMVTIGIAANESAWGTSNIAQNKNNLFGHAAYDSDPNGSSNKYSTPAFSVYYHTSTFMSKQYLYPKNWKYNGGFLGDKASGINVKYASDPYWGEKAAAHAWIMDKELGGKDAYRYTIGIKDRYNFQFTKSTIKRDAKDSSTSLYETKNYDSNDIISNYAFINLDNNVSNGYYKIQSDAPLNSGRTSIVNQDQYSFSTSYGYISNNNVIIVSKGNNSSSDDIVEEPSYKKGDVNGDGNITAVDYMLIKNHIMGVKKMTGSVLERGDVNDDGNITAVDYMLIKNHIMGVKLLF
ncbi:MAG: glucosaminidase domain-containing protein [Erysipelotrichales bacterium]|nr:glucosaminidase domain-containing protein [Erysipelotrichales bacterium]